ncbi:hypothetical protein BH10PSE4_BH10PSE4_25600 [soil metagenome]
MDLGAALDVAIGLIFIYLLVSLFVTALQEFISSKFSKRSQYLVERIESLLSDGQTGWSKELQAVWNHPLIKALKSDDTTTEGATTAPKTLFHNAPSYISARTFALALIEILGPDGKAQTTLDELKRSVEALPNERLRQVLLPMITGADGKIENFQKQVGEWFDSAMDRASGVYKRWAQRVTFGLGIGAAVFFNINTFGVIDTLWRDPVARAALVAQAQHAELPPAATAGPPPVTAPGSSGTTEPVTPVTTPAPAPGAAAATATTAEQAAQDKTLNDNRADAEKAIRDLPLPVGWTWENVCQLSRYPHAGAPDAPIYKDGRYMLTCSGPDRGPAMTVWQVILALAGILVTGLAVSLGAPFWFGMLQTVTNIRASGKKPDRTDGTPQK